MHALIPKKISVKQAGDTGMAATLVLLIVGIYSGSSAFIIAAAIVLLMNMIAPRIYTPLGYIWFGLSNVLGAIVSRILLGIIYFVVVTPVGLLRRIGKKDNLKLNLYKKNQNSLYTERNKKYTPEDLEKPF